MNTQFYILLSFKTKQGFENYGQYFIGNDPKVANELFDQLVGSKLLTDNTLLHVDLMETIDQLPVKIKSICCTLDELAENCKFIAKEVFRLKNLENLL